MVTILHKGKHPFFSFDRKIKFTASLDLAFAQNQSFKQPPRTGSDTWQKQPPDFSYKLYQTSQPPPQARQKEKEQKKSKSSKADTIQQLSLIYSSQFLPPLGGKKKLPMFVTRFPQVGLYEAEIMFVKNGKYKTGTYQDPKPYDFRQSEANMPEFVTSYARDPFNLKFKSQNLNTVYRLEPLIEKQRDVDRRFVTYKPRECKWDSRLILPKNPWPPKSASFTRHKRRRGAYTAFLDRVEERLSNIWQHGDPRLMGRTRREQRNGSSTAISNIPDL
ncbi:PREDICTED: uncharacterized protein LOC109291450 isoform X1 [Gavialis gangeticus]|uniref:uncharacterized protein LOC109291450 isoform X1 n=1 Tax=Gavialis gangeticus TaxID=94835 RepID=UPI00092FC0D0|nr:PREDICTED: uncharacterized protein LOC109291450 isoform X1 [Gavialis gangeticus]XP_019364040.1 PREDICTED: uncharacterized protein LOC109291450 isoform X1 [Gavialis gangeticus]